MQDTLHVLGLMSGTSLDGLDICHASFQKNETNQWSFTIHEAQTIPYPDDWCHQLKNAIHLAAEELLSLDVAYGFYLGERVLDFIQQHQLISIDLIASHGHTVFHQPQKKFTLQIGDGRAIKLVTQIPVAYDFRMQDVLMGGNGAPLVPIGDEFLFSKYDACINLGGFSNISLAHQSKRIAFDICPVNIVLNHLATHLGFDYDDQGTLSKKGKIHPTILQQLNDLEFYSFNYPKSLGLEWVVHNIYPIISEMDEYDALATFTEHIAVQISQTLNFFKLKNALFTGGGVYNSYLIEKIQSKTDCTIIIPSDTIIQYKEALIFALMGALRWNNQINVLSSATGSSHDHCSGLLV
ncbi:MAG: anhydro-N-acetylmuramic acid kinase [Bacteroidetes bacterium]|nr:anhydro-N-acetylmuramic acid kinase [Bacteroidota bacterium]